MSAQGELPPGLLRTLLKRLLPDDVRGESIRGDLLEEFRTIEMRDGRASAIGWYRRQATRVLVAAAMGRISRRAVRRTSRVPWLDVRLGIRMLAKHPGMTLVSVFALAIGIPFGLFPLHLWSAITAPLPVDQPERVVMLREYHERSMRSHQPSMFDFQRWNEHLTSYEAIAAASLGLSYNIAREDAWTAPVPGAEVTASAFAVLRTEAMLGRTFGPEDERMGAPDVVVIGHDVWTSRLAAAPGVVGSTIRVNGVPHTVVGVMPKGFLFPARTQLWLPLRVDEAHDAHGRSPTHIVFGRLADGTSIAEAQTEFSVVGRRLDDDLAEVHAELEPEVLPFTLAYLDDRKGGLRADSDWYVVQFMALLVLFVACANVGMLVFARTARRSSELALRTALGASRNRLIAQLFAEAMVFVALATGLGIVASDILAVHLQRSMGPELDLPYWSDLRVTARSALLGIGLGVLSAGVAGVLPAVKFTGRAIQRTMQRGAAAGTGVRFGGGSSALIVADVALCVVVCAFALGISVSVRDMPEGQGPDTGGYLSAQLWLPEVDVPRTFGGGPNTGTTEVVRSIHEGLTERLDAEPAVRRVTLANALPGTDHRYASMSLDDGTSGEGRRFDAATAAVDLGYFDAFDRPVLYGRDFDSGDLEAGSGTVIVNTTFVDLVLEGRNPLGRRVRYRFPGDGPWFEIVGVVADLGTYETNIDAEGAVYHPMAPGSHNPVQLALEIGDDPEAWVPRLRTIAADIDPTAIISHAVPLDQVVSYERRAFLWGRYGVAAGLVILLTLSISGLYSLMSFIVAERTKEIGIRIALGARRRTIVLTIGKRTIWQLGLGVLLGLPIAVTWLDGYVYGSMLITRGTALSLGLALGVTVLVVIGVSAGIGPTMRALRIEATEALREGG